MKLYYIIITILIIFIILTFIYYYKYNNNHNVLDDFTIIYNNNTKPYLWLYWDNLDNKERSAIELCYKTVIFNCSNSFNIIRLNKNNILEWLPEIEKYKQYIDNLQIAHKVDIYRIMLLYKYGGLYIDADIIVLRDPIEIIQKLDLYDYVGFGCTGMVCSYGYGKPSNAMMASRQKSILMGNVLIHLLKKIQEKDKFEYFDLGKLVIWEEIANIKDYKYYHYTNNFDGTRDKHGKWVTSDIIFSSEPIEYVDPDNMIFLMWYNSEIKDNIKTMSEEELMSKDWNFTNYVKKALYK
jgi:hypothetical protein